MGTQHLYSVSQRVISSMNIILLTLLSMTLISCQDIPIKGKDHLGRLRTCEPMAMDTICTRDMREADYYAIECHEKGMKVVQCDCHDFICLEKE